MHASPSSGSASNATPKVETLLSFQNVHVGYGRRRVLENLSFDIESDDYLAIVGSNGSGKTTLLRSLLGLLSPLGGTIAMPRGPLHFGYVPQLQSIDEIFPLTVLEIVLMGLYGRLGLIKRPGAKEREKARASLEEVGVVHLENRLFRELSGGQKQRTLVARAIVSEPDVLVLDEHTNNLDIAGEKSIMGLVDELHTRHGVAVVMVTHSLNTVANHAKHIGIIRDGKFDFHAVGDVMQTDYLCEFYGVPVQVLEVDGKRVVV